MLSVTTQLRWNAPKDAEAAKLSEGNEEARGSPHQPFSQTVFQSHPTKLWAWMLDVAAVNSNQAPTILKQCILRVSSENF